MEEIKKKCIEYDKALERNHPTAPAWKPGWELSKLISRNLFGKLEKSLNFVPVHARIVFATKHLRELIKKFDIE